MRTAIVIKGRLTGPRSVELEESVSNAKGEVEVIVRTDDNGGPRRIESMVDFLRRIPAGQRSREDIDRQIQEERHDWGNGG
ncbi:MAG: hypothetical protein ABSB42_14040 [Tepidisphaeraceae bacterium]|jgi:hypothetical protein